MNTKIQLRSHVAKSENTNKITCDDDETLLNSHVTNTKI